MPLETLSKTSFADAAPSLFPTAPSLLRADLSLTAVPRHVYRRAAVSNASQEKSDEALGKSIATADRNEVVFPADTVFPRRPDKTHHYISYYI